MGAKKIAEMGRTAKSHGIRDFRDRLLRVLRRDQQIVASLQSPEPQPFRGRHVHEPEKMMSRLSENCRETAQTTVPVEPNKATIPVVIPTIRATIASLLIIN